jgi:hypothetical protein
MDVMGPINRALALVARMPQRAVADNTLLAYHEKLGECGERETWTRSGPATRWTHTTADELPSTPSLRG